MDLYSKTVASMDGYSNNMPRRTDWSFDVASWSILRRGLVDVRRKQLATTTDPARRASIEERDRQTQEPAFDGWGSEILRHFDSAERKATFVSIGPDKQKGTDDDVICFVSGRRG